MDPIDDANALTDQSLAHSMQRLEVGYPMAANRMIQSNLKNDPYRVTRQTSCRCGQ
jgi:hypothetical protein